MFNKNIVRLLAVIFIFDTMLFAVGCTAMNQNDGEMLTEALSNAEETTEFEYFPLLASDESQNIFLYGVRKSGVVLYVDGAGHYYDWEYKLPNAENESRELIFADENKIFIATTEKDSEDEYYQRLRIIYDNDFDDVYELDNDYFRDIADNEIQYSYDNESVTFSFDGKNYIFDLSESFGSFEPEEVSYGKNVTFSVSDGKIFAVIKPEVINYDGETVEIDITIKGELGFEDGNISLNNITVKGLEIN